MENTIFSEKALSRSWQGELCLVRAPGVSTGLSSPSWHPHQRSLKSGTGDHGPCFGHGWDDSGNYCMVLWEDKEILGQLSLLPVCIRSGSVASLGPSPREGQ